MCPDFYLEDTVSQENHTLVLCCKNKHPECGVERSLHDHDGPAHAQQAVVFIEFRKQNVLQEIVVLGLS